MTPEDRDGDDVEVERDGLKRDDRKVTARHIPFAAPALRFIRINASKLQAFF